jgi:Flp pilus assembly protein TadG
MRGLNQIREDQAGAAAVEFAILGPTVFVMMLGALQVGIGMQAYNAMRSASAQTARYAVVERQQAATVTATSIRTQAITVATSVPYALESARLTTSVDTPATQRVTGATEYTLTYTYSVPTVLSIIGLDSIPLSYSRPIFVIT